MERLERIEQENRNLAAEVHALRERLETSGQAGPPSAAVSSEPPAPPLEERVSTTERRVEELAQTKMETSQKFPVKLTGTLLFNTFMNGRANGGAQYPTLAATGDNRNAGGASFTQSIVGLVWDGPTIWGGGKVNGSLNMDFAAGSSAPLNHLVRLRVADLNINWKNQSITVGQDKPIISAREPTSLAQVAVSPLTGAGNPWLWQPQIRFEQRLAFGDSTGLRAQAGVYQTAEPASNAGAFSDTLSSSRPALQGRFELWRNLSHGARVEIAPGFHVSQTHVAGVSIPSRLFSVDWMIRPFRKTELTGLFFSGNNSNVMGGLRQSFILRNNNNFLPIHTKGGWAQLSYSATSRLTFNFYGGQESFPANDLATAMITRNFVYAGNWIYKLGPNLLLSFEASQARTSYLNRPNRLNNHYDLALAYLF